MRAGDLDEVQKYDIGNLLISRCELTSLEGCPEEVKGEFDCRSNYLTSFEHFPKRISTYCFISNNKFTSFKDIDKHIELIEYSVFANYMHITSGFSDLFGIDKLIFIEIDNKKIQDIVNKYLRQKDIINFQDEMIKSGFESYL